MKDVSQSVQPGSPPSAPTMFVDSDGRKPPNGCTGDFTASHAVVLGELDEILRETLFDGQDESTEYGLTSHRKENSHVDVPHPSIRVEPMPKLRSTAPPQLYRMEGEVVSVEARRASRLFQRARMLALSFLQAVEASEGQMEGLGCAYGMGIGGLQVRDLSALSISPFLCDRR